MINICQATMATVTDHVTDNWRIDRWWFINFRDPDRCSLQAQTLCPLATWPRRKHGGCGEHGSKTCFAEGSKDDHGSHGSLGSLAISGEAKRRRCYAIHTMPRYAETARIPPLWISCVRDQRRPRFNGFLVTPQEGPCSTSKSKISICSNGSNFFLNIQMGFW